MVCGFHQKCYEVLTNVLFDVDFVVETDVR